MSFDQFYAAMEAGADTKTAQVNVDEYIQYFRPFLEQGKDVFAVPGNIDSITSKGTNKLIYDGANIFTASDDLF